MCVCVCGSPACSPFLLQDTCPKDIVPTAWTEDGTIMACHHRIHTHIQGVQFHPESVITDNGMAIVRNFVKSLKIPATS